MSAPLPIPVVAPPKRRNGAKPTRNGCRTCRMRKVKCDETKPACNRCTSTGRTCDGEIGAGSLPAYRPRLIPRDPRLEPTSTTSTSSQSSESDPSTTASSGTSSTLSILPGSISTWQSLSPHLSDRERYGFQHFQDPTAPALQVMLPSSEWVPVALQLSVEQPVVFHAIAATGTMARAVTVLLHPSFPRPIQQDIGYEATAQYAKAISILRKHVDMVVSTSVADESILLACLLCVVFEAIRGQKTAAMEHARLGWEIVKNNPRSYQEASSPSARFFHSIFGERSGASALFDDKEQHDSCCCLNCPFFSPALFGSMGEATEHLTTLTKASEHFRLELLNLAKVHVTHMTGSEGMLERSRFCLAACLSRSIAISDLHQIRFEQLQRAHVQWTAAYAAYKQELTLEDMEDDLPLRIRYFYSSLTLATCRNTEEVLTDRFRNEFAETIDCIEGSLAVAGRKSPVVQHSSSDRRAEGTYFGFSILPALNLIAHKCRDQQLRRRALDLMFTARKLEGLESSNALGHYASALAELETQRGNLSAQDNPTANDGASGSMLPEEARFSDVVTVAEGGLGVFGLLCARYVHYGSETKQIELSEYEGAAKPPRLCSSWVVAV